MRLCKIQTVREKERKFSRNIKALLRDETSPTSLFNVAMFSQCCIVALPKLKCTESRSCHVKAMRFILVRLIYFIE